MKAALCKTLTGPEGLVIEDIEVPKPGSGEALVRVRAAGLNFMDTLITRGKYQFKPELPFSPAAEIAGTIEAMGPDCAANGLQAGQRVCAYIGWGGAREYLLLRPENLIPIPDGVSAEVAAGVSVTYGTAIHGLKDRGHLAAGETVAVLGAAGGAGLAALEIAKRLGARVIACASSDDKLALCRAQGADDVINYSREDLKQRLRDLTGNRGADVIYDCVGGDYAEAALRSIAWMGRFLVVGFAAGAIPRIPLNLTLLKSCDIRGVFWGEAAARDPLGHRANIAQVLSWIADGSMHPQVNQCLPLEKITEAIGILDRREARGKVVLTL